MLDASLDLIIERHRDLLKRGAILLDERDLGEQPRILFQLEHSIQDAVVTRGGQRRVVSKQLLYVEMSESGETRSLHYAPYLDYRPLTADEPGVDALLARPECAWLAAGLEARALDHAVAHIVPEHFAEVKTRKQQWIAKTEAAVKDRLTKEIAYWDHRSNALHEQEEAGKPNARLNSNEARKRADSLQGRLQKRMEELAQEAKLSPLPPVVIGGVLVVPLGLLRKLHGGAAPATTHAPTTPIDTSISAARARAVIMEVESQLGFVPTDRELEKLGYDIESRIPGTGRLRFIEVKGRITGAATITVTRNEILYSLNKPDDFILAIVEFLDGDTHRVHYIRQPFRREPDFGVTSVNYDFADLLAKATIPS